MPHTASIWRELYVFPLKREPMWLCAEPFVMQSFVPPVTAACVFFSLGRVVFFPFFLFVVLGYFCPNLNANTSLGGHEHCVPMKGHWDLYVCNIPSTASEAALKDFFTHRGGPIERLMLYSKSKSASIQFCRSSDAEAILSSSQFVLDGVVLWIKKHKNGGTRKSPSTKKSPSSSKRSSSSVEPLAPFRSSRVAAPAFEGEEGEAVWFVPPAAKKPAWEESVWVDDDRGKREGPIAELNGSARALMIVVVTEIMATTATAVAAAIARVRAEGGIEESERKSR
jgi:hypothetical protein